MNNAKLLLRNNLFIFSNRIVAKLATFLILVFMARKLSVEDFGAFAILTSLSAVFSLLHDLGSNFVVVRETAKNQIDRRKLLATVLFMKACFAVGCMSLFMLVIHLFGYSEIIKENSMYFAVGMIGDSFLLSLLKHYEGREEMKYSSIFVISERVIIIGVIVVTSFFLPVLTAYGIGYLISNMLVFIFGLLWTIKPGEFVRFVDMKTVRAIIKMSMPFLVFNIFAIIYVRADIFILERFRTVGEVGIYRACTQLIESVYFIPISLSVSLLPFFSRYYTENIERLKELFPYIFNKVLVAGLFLAISVALNSKMILSTLYKDKFNAGSLTFSIVALAIPLYFVNNICGNLLVASGREKYQAASAVISTVIKCILLFVLVGMFGMLGAAVSFIAGEVISFTVQYFGVTKSVFVTSFWRTEIFSIIILSFFAVASVFSGSIFWSAFLILAAGTLIGFETFRQLKRAFRNL